jgi:hypothetical protein
LKGSPATSLEIALTDQVPADESYSLMLTVGVRYGSPMEDDVVEEVKRAGAAKVVAIAGWPEGDGSGDKLPVSDTMSEVVKGDGEMQAMVPVQSAATCTYGWHYAVDTRSIESIQPPEHSLKAETTTPTHAEIEGSSVKAGEITIPTVPFLIVDCKQLQSLPIAIGTAPALTLGT